MANISISNLPTYTGSPTDVRWFVMNNSGNTETFKYSGYTSYFKPAAGTDSYVPYYHTGGSNITSKNSILLNGNSTQGSITGGDGFNLLGAVNGNSSISNCREAVILGSGGGSITNASQCGLYSSVSSSINGGNFSAAIANFGANVAGNYNLAGGNRLCNVSGGANGIIAGERNNINGDEYNFIGGGDYNTITSSVGSSIIGGTNNTITSLDSVVMLGTLNRTAVSSATTHTENLHIFNNINSYTGNTISGTNSFIIGAEQSSITDEDFTGILGGKQNTMTNSNNDGMNMIVNGYRSDINGLGRNNLILGGENNDGSGGCNWSFLLAGQGNQINGGNGGGVIGSDNSQYKSGNNGVIISSNAALIGNAGGANYASIIGSTNASLDGGNRNVVLATENNSFQNNSQTILAGGYGHNLTNNTDSGAFAGRQNQIDSARQAAIVGGISNDIPGLENAVIIGSSGRTALYSGTTHTDNIHTFQTESFTEYNGGNVGGSIDVDCSQGSFYLFTMTADTTPNFINVRDGQRFFFIVYNNGAWAVPTATLNGAAGKVMAKNGTINPQNNSYSKYVATYDSVNDLLFLDEETGFSAV